MWLVQNTQLASLKDGFNLIGLHVRISFIGQGSVETRNKEI